MLDNVGQVTDRNKSVVARYFAEIDRRNVAAVPELVASDCVFHRSDRPDALHGVEAVQRLWSAVLASCTELRTEVHVQIAEGDLVACRISHRATVEGEFPTRLGSVLAKGKALSWQAIAIFRVLEGKIAEQWVVLDEVSQLQQLGAMGSMISSTV